MLYLSNAPLSSEFIYIFLPWEWTELSRKTYHLVPTEPWIEMENNLAITAICSMTHFFFIHDQGWASTFGWIIHRSYLHTTY